MKNHTRLSKRLFGACMAAIMAGSSVTGGNLTAYGAVPSQGLTVMPGAGTMVSGISTPASVTLADPQAAACAAQLFAYLQGVGQSPYVLYGHQNDTHHKGGYDFAGSTSSDTKDVTGSIAAILGLDALSFTGAELPIPAGKKDSVDEAAALSLQAANEGAIITLSAHMPNFSLVAEKGKDADGDYDYSGYSPGNTKGDVMGRILPGGT